MNKYAIIGFGRWGKKVFFNKNLNKKFSKVFIKSQNKNIINSINNNIIYNIKNIRKYLCCFDSAHICTPVLTHYKIAKFLIENKKNVIIEKPITNSLLKINKLEKLANDNHVKVIVNYNDIYDPGILLLKKIAKKKYIKKIKIYYSSHKLYLSKFDFVYDWLDHILIILNFFKMLKPDLNLKKYKLINKNKKMFLTLLFKNKLKNIEIEVNINNLKKERSVKLFFSNGKWAVYSNHKNPGVLNYFNNKKKTVSKKIFRDNLYSLYSSFEKKNLNRKINLNIEKKIFIFKENILRKIFT